jgi:uncharacterized membrane protein YedE/YeeE
MLRLTLSFLSGLIFALGLGLSGMTDPAKVQGFLRLGDGWDPSLALVMAGAIAVHLGPARWSLRAAAPPFDEAFHRATLRDIDARLIGGSALFGAGWALAGYCPGPALVAAAAGRGEALLFTASMMTGMAIFAVAPAFLERLRGATPAADEALTPPATPEEAPADG